VSEAPPADRSAIAVAAASPGDVAIDDVAIGDVPTPGSADTTAADDGSTAPFGRSMARPWAGGVLSTGSRLDLALGGVDLPPYAQLLSVTMTTTGVVVLTFAFGFFAKRRRDGDPTDPDEVLQARSGLGATFATAGLAPTLASDGGPSWPTPSSDDPESHLPRWRRPSLQAARKADPARMEQVHVAMTFTGAGVAGDAPIPAVLGGVDPLDGLERRRIKYRLVRLLDGPDELRAAELGYLDEGDEVQLISQRGAYWFVLCPNGQQGWIHRMTLGQVVQPMRPVGPASAVTASPALTMDGSGDDEIDPDVMAAFLTNQRAAN
jgi:hypothetical protein